MPEIRRKEPLIIQTHKPEETMAIDPVCKMEVDESKAAATAEHECKTYYFCAVGCQKKFQENPSNYIKSKGCCS